jgi:hypothetical protein
MKKTILSIMVLASILLNAEGNFQAKLIDVKIFKGDLGKGNMNKCTKFLVLETYELLNTDLNGIVISHTVDNKPTVLRKREYKEINTNYISYPYCISSKAYKAKIQTKFLNSNNMQSNTIEFTTDTKNLKLHDADQYPHHEKIK